MGGTRFLNRRKENRVFDTNDALLRALVSTDEITRSQALNIPSVSSCVEIIGNTIAMLPIKLYSENNGEITELKDDNRVALLNDNTGDMLSGYQFKKALVSDYLLDGAGYAYINRSRNTVKSLHYVSRSNMSFLVSTDPIFKRCEILINGQIYKNYEFLKITRNTEDGVRGRGIVEENNLLLSVAYNALKYEDVLNKTGGNKKGFLMSEKKLDKESMDSIKTAYSNLYKGNTENMIVLNSGIEFKEIASSSTEMQMNENKKANSIEICKIFNVPAALLGDSSTVASSETDYANLIKTAILPILNAIESAANEDLLLKSERKSHYFQFDTREILKGSIIERYKAYSEAVKAGWISKNEIRYMENYQPVEGLDVVTMSLGDVIFDIESKKYFTPNTESIVKSDMKGSEGT